MQTRQRSLTHNQIKRSYSFSHMPKKQQIGSRILNKHNIRSILIFKPSKKIGQILRNPKDQRPPLNSAGVYKIPCSCRQVYIGETGRIVNLRIKEHQRDVRLKHITHYQNTTSKQDIKYCLTKRYHNSQHYIILSKKV